MREPDTITPTIPRIGAVLEGIARPLWSVMIPNYNSGEYLRKTLQSVLAQDRGSEQMQIEVVDHCSTEGDPEALVRAIGGGRVAFYRRPKNEGAVANFNACIQRSRGHLIHILHSDDYILPGFYAEIERLAKSYANAALLATRCFYVDESDVITDVTPRIPGLEQNGRSAEPLYYNTPIQSPGVVIRREFHEAYGGYITDLVHVADREMWVRAISLGGGVLSSGVLACYRMAGSNDSATVLRSGENVRDLLRVAELFQKKYPGFSIDHARRVASYTALQQARRFSALNDRNSAQANWRLWVENCSWLDRIKEAARPLAHRIFGNDK
jgi:glycosyltransferase involved in cell wall biosynthesis